jgi:hypothetical protein
VSEVGLDVGQRRSGPAGPVGRVSLLSSSVAPGVCASPVGPVAVHHHRDVADLAANWAGSVHWFRRVQVSFFNRIFSILLTFLRGLEVWKRVCVCVSAFYNPLNWPSSLTWTKLSVISSLSPWKAGLFVTLLTSVSPSLNFTFSHEIDDLWFSLPLTLRRHAGGWFFIGFRAWFFIRFPPGDLWRPRGTGIRSLCFYQCTVSSLCFSHRFFLRVVHRWG